MEFEDIVTRTVLEVGCEIGEKEEVETEEEELLSSPEMG